MYFWTELEEKVNGNAIYLMDISCHCCCVKLFMLLTKKFWVMPKGLWKIASKSVSGAADCAYSLSFLSHIFFSSISTSIRNLCCYKPTKLTRKKSFVGELQTLIHWSHICCWSELVFSLSLSLSLCFFSCISPSLCQRPMVQKPTKLASEKNSVGELKP